MTDVLEFSDVSAEIKGALCPGRLKLTDQQIIFKNNKTGKVEQISSGDFDLCNWQKLVGGWGLRIFLKNGTLHRFCGFKEGEQEKVAKYFKKMYSYDLLEKELCLKGWNWGTAKFNGSVLSFDINSQAAFEVPLSYVSQCTTGKNEVAIEFHQNDETPVSLMEMRFYIPTSELAGDDPVEAFKSQVMKKASVISIFGDAIAIFREIHCVTPRGRYDIKLFQSFFQLHGKTFDYKIPMETVIRLFVLPHKDGRQNFFVVSLDPPIKQGQTRYHYLVFLFNQDEETSIELPFSEEELKEKYEGKLSKELSGPTYEVVSRVMKTLVNRKVTVPGNFKGHSGTAAIGCSYKAAAGSLYPLERGFIFIHKPPIHIRFEEISSVNFARSGGSTKSFDFEVELKSGVVHTFSSIEKEEYSKLYDFIGSKKLRVKNKKSDKPDYSGMDDFGNSDVEDEHDAYLARVKREGKEREEEDGGDSEDESEDEDFKPGQEESDVAEEYESNPDTTSDSDEEGSGNESGDSAEKKEKKEKKKKEKKEKKEKKAKTVSEKPRKKRRTKKEKDVNAPKRAPSAYMLWFNESREQIKKDYPGLSVTETAKKAGELWKTLSDRAPWDKKALKLKEEYVEAMKAYKASGGGIKKDEDSDGEAKPKEEKKKNTEKKKAAAKKKENVSPTKAGSGANFISKEFIETDDSDESGGSDDSSKAAKKKEKSSAKAAAKPEKKAKAPKSDEKGSGSESKGSESDAKESESDAKDSESDKESEKASKKSNDKPKKKEKESGGESEGEEEEEEEILSTPTASSASDSD